MVSLKEHPLKRAAILWKSGPVEGSVEVFHGALASLSLPQGSGRTNGNAFSITSSGPCRLLVELADAVTRPGSRSTRVTVNAKTNPFTFFLRDVTADFPVFIPDYGVVVTSPDEMRPYDEIVRWIRSRGLISQLDAIENAPEESYQQACRANRNLVSPAWLGLSRDMRIFEVGYSLDYGYWGYVRPLYYSTEPRIPETEDKPYNLNFVVGPGDSCRFDITRRLEEGCLPILHSTQSEDSIIYELTLFVTLETRPLSPQALQGSHWQACYANSVGHMLTDDELRSLRPLIGSEMHARPEETVCCVRVEVSNRGGAPAYAWFRGLSVGLERGRQCPAEYDSATGFGSFPSGRIFGVHRLNGKPAPDREMALLLQPGERVAYDILIPHQPISTDRARSLAALDLPAHLDACRNFWKARLASAASVSLPEPAVDERLKAGLLHCDLVAFGQEPDGTVLAAIGRYSPIGSESSPIIQFFDAMGWHDLARRSLNFFLDRQRDDGFMQNFAGYQVETGPVLWSIGEHFRFTRNTDWIRSIEPKLLKACDYLLAWRTRNKRDDLRGNGFGLLDGKVADPDDFFHSFMLNGLSFLGISRVAEILQTIDPPQSRRLAAEARAFREDIRAAFYEALARSPVIPLADGTWCPSVPPWTESSGPVSLYAEGGNWFTHGAFGGRDSLIGPLYLVLSEVIDPRETGADSLLRSHQQLFTVKNAGLSQPYYCRHDFIHLKRGEVKPFLKTYYNQFAAIQDRETYTFWEHYHHGSQHKTHEEAWFLMQTRWMLLMEDGSTLHMLPAIPRAWMSSGNHLSFEDMRTYFGPVSLCVESNLARGVIKADYSLDPARKPAKLTLRLPHPEGLSPRETQGGVYDPATESVTIDHPPAKGSIILRF